MPIHDTNRIEYAIDSGHIHIVTDDGERVPAYWAHPRIGNRFSGICLLHDWWGSERVTRLVSNFFAQMGYYVIAPDMYLGETAQTPARAMKLYQKSQVTRFATVDAALTVLETHHRVNRSVATIGIGMGGTLSFEAAIKRDDLEAAIAYSGFPQDHFGQFAQSNTPILALYGQHEPYVKAPIIAQLRAELADTPLRDQHRVIVVDDAGRDFFSSEPDPHRQHITKHVLSETLDFLEQYLEKPSHRPKKRF